MIFRMVITDFFSKDIREKSLLQAQSVVGKLVLVAVFAALFSMDANASYPLVIAAILLCTFAPRYRWHITALATLAVFLMNPFWFNSLLPASKPPYRIRKPACLTPRLSAGRRW
jgi:integral membrane sensor domain MASE1